MRTGRNYLLYVLCIVAGGIDGAFAGAADTGAPVSRGRVGGRLGGLMIRGGLLDWVV